MGRSAYNARPARGWQTCHVCLQRWCYVCELADSDEALGADLTDHQDPLYGHNVQWQADSQR